MISVEIAKNIYLSRSRDSRNTENDYRCSVKGSGEGARGLPETQWSCMNGGSEG